MRRIAGIALAGAVLLAGAGNLAAAGEGFKVVVNRANPAPGLPREKVAFMFMKVTAKWEHGAAVEPADQPASSAVRAAFSRSIHRRDVDAVQAAWQRAVFSGRGEPPPELASDAEVIAWVAARPGGIGYVSESAPTDAVKVLAVAQ